MLESVHDELAAGDPELVNAAFDETAYLLRVPALVGQQANVSRSEAQNGHVSKRTAEYAVGMSKIAIKHGVRDRIRRPAAHPGVVNGVESEDVQPVPQVAPCVQVPVVAAVGEPFGETAWPETWLELRL